MTHTWSVQAAHVSFSSLTSEKISVPNIRNIFHRFVSTIFVINLFHLPFKTLSDLLESVFRPQPHTSHNKLSGIHMCSDLSLSVYSLSVSVSLSQLSMSVCLFLFLFPRHPLSIVYFISTINSLYCSHLLIPYIINIIDKVCVNTVIQYIKLLYHSIQITINAIN